MSQMVWLVVRMCLSQMFRLECVSAGPVRMFVRWCCLNLSQMVWLVVRMCLRWSDEWVICAAGVLNPALLTVRLGRVSNSQVRSACGDHAALNRDAQ